MKKITVNASKQYDILIEKGLLNRLGELCRQVTKGDTIAVVTDSTVNALYGDRAEEQLKNAGYRVLRYVFPAGEESKNTDTYLKIIHWLAENHVTRQDTLLALGGGVTGDMGGFAAATFLRGIPYIQVPTTLLASVDSSVGGKTAVDLPMGKNLLGAFWQPSMVICDTELLNTLSEEIVAAGMGEVIKYGMIWDKDFFDALERGELGYEDIIARCVSIKQEVVSRDEYDNGLRQILNFGHTFGHGVEANSRFTIPHGFGVAIGMVIMTRALVKKGRLPQDTLERLQKVLRQYGLPVDCEYTAEQLMEAVLSDKKRRSGSIGLIVLNRIGQAEIEKMPIGAVPEYLKLGLEE